MKKEKCELLGCEDDIPAWRHGNATTCCDEHGELLKKARDAAGDRQHLDPAGLQVRLDGQQR